jgi:hypothetical protein
LKTAWSWIVRIGVIALCAFLTAWSVKMAVADWRAAHNGMEGLESAIRLEPEDSVLVARAALAKNANGEMSAEVDRELLHAAAMNPYAADVQMALGLREEFRGHLAEAERYLVHAAEIDHTFKPAWTLANFYVRQDQAEKMWPVMKRGLALDLSTSAFDPKPVFDLCWNETSDSRKILELIPTRGVVPLQYLSYLINTKRTDASIAVWPQATDALQTIDPMGSEAMIRFVEFLEQENRMTDAVRVWNQLVDHHIVSSGQLDPERSISIADPDFSFPPIERGLGWRVTHDAGVYVGRGTSSLHFEFDGNEPESSVLLTTIAPIVSNRAYRLVWKTDASEMSARRDSGFAWQIVQQPGNATTICPPMLEAGDEGVCQFRSVPNAVKGRLSLTYKRATGTRRVEGILRLSNVKLELGS